MIFNYSHKIKFQQFQKLWNSIKFKSSLEKLISLGWTNNEAYKELKKCYGFSFSKKALKHTVLHFYGRLQQRKKSVKQNGKKRVLVE